MRNRKLPIIDYNNVVKESTIPGRAGLVIYAKQTDKILVVKNGGKHDLFVIDEKRPSYKKFKIINDVNRKIGTRFKTRGTNDNGIYFHPTERVDMFYKIVSDELSVPSGKNGERYVWVDIGSLGGSNATPRLRWAVTRARKFQTMRSRRNQRQSSS